MTHTNIQTHNPDLPHFRHRAVVAADGSVSLIADILGMTMDVIPLVTDRSSTTVKLSPAQYKNLHAMSAPANKRLVYDHFTGKFSARTIGSVNS
jgi:hypothetical protein